MRSRDKSVIFFGEELGCCKSKSVSTRFAGGLMPIKMKAACKCRQLLENAGKSNLKRIMSDCTTIFFYDNTESIYCFAVHKSGEGMTIIRMPLIGFE